MVKNDEKWDETWNSYLFGLSCVHFLSSAWKILLLLCVGILFQNASSQSCFRFLMTHLGRQFWPVLTLSVKQQKCWTSLDLQSIQLSLYRTFQDNNRVFRLCSQFWRIFVWLWPIPEKEKLLKNVLGSCLCGKRFRFSICLNLQASHCLSSGSAVWHCVYCKIRNSQKPSS